MRRTPARRPAATSACNSADGLADDFMSASRTSSQWAHTALIDCVLVGRIPL
ncbi:hypothetical protein ACH4SK_16345 [Streptomyces inhibens]|uniref:hypothetical protein n=1 Tax=Streptomyces inhibens TaxID=2293571 RepID=UPI0037AD4CCF